MNSNTQKITIRIPPDLDFSALKLTRDPCTGGITFDWAPIERICKASGVEVALFRDLDEDNVSRLIVRWYVEHLKRGGARDAVQDGLLAEILAEDSLGVGLSHRPGRA